jgi:hypothetical protein
MISSDTIEERYRRLRHPERHVQMAWVMADPDLAH